MVAATDIYCRCVISDSEIYEYCIREASCQGLVKSILVVPRMLRSPSRAAVRYGGCANDFGTIVVEGTTASSDLISLATFVLLYTQSSSISLAKKTVEEAICTICCHGTRLTRRRTQLFRTKQGFVTQSEYSMFHDTHKDPENDS